MEDRQELGLVLLVMLHQRRHHKGNSMLLLFRLLWNGMPSLLNPNAGQLPRRLLSHLQIDVSDPRAIGEVPFRSGALNEC